MGIELTPRARGILGVRAETGNATKILAELQKTFEDFKVERDKELADIRAGMADVVQTEKVDRINAEITALQKALDETMPRWQRSRSVLLAGRPIRTRPNMPRPSTASSGAVSMPACVISRSRPS